MGFPVGVPPSIFHLPRRWRRRCHRMCALRFGSFSLFLLVVPYVVTLVLSCYFCASHLAAWDRILLFHPCMRERTHLCFFFPFFSRASVMRCSLPARFEGVLSLPIFFRLVLFLYSTAFDFVSFVVFGFPPAALWVQSRCIIQAFET